MKLILILILVLSSVGAEADVFRIQSIPLRAFLYSLVEDVKGKRSDFQKCFILKTLSSNDPYLTVYGEMTKNEAWYYALEVSGHTEYILDNGCSLVGTKDEILKLAEKDGRILSLENDEEFVGPPSPYE